jgi:4-hydroxy-4-methyl-2-oxoglutarate aldolase
MIYKRIPRLPRDLVERVRGIGVADLHEALGPVAGRMALMSPAMRPLRRDAQIVGPAVTAYNYPGDNMMMHVALHLAEPGDVLVLTNGGSADGALWGEIAGLQAQAKGIEGVVVGGAIRDSAALAAMGARLWSTAISVSHPDKKTAGAVNVPIVCDGVLVHPGDLVVADADGVLAIPRAEIAGAVERAQARMAKEVGMRAAIERGETVFEQLRIAETLEALGCEIRDEEWRPAPR